MPSQCESGGEKSTALVGNANWRAQDGAQYLGVHCAALPIKEIFHRIDAAQF